MGKVSGDTVLIMAGGTGGHVYPALAVAEVLRQRGWHVAWLGTANGIEARVVPQQNITLHHISAVGLRGKSVQKWLAAPWQLLRSVWQAWHVFQRERPAVVLGMGGFVSGPGGLCASGLRVPLVIHEQNAVAGTANRLLARVAQCVLTAFPQVLPRGVFVGNPVRDDIALLSHAPRQPWDGKRPLRLLVVGGSLGARALNTVLPAALAELTVAERPDVLHQTGRALHAETQEQYARVGVQARIEPYIEDMASAYRWADLAICRAGAMTVSELACAQLPSLLVPFPHAIDDHQTANARWLSDAGAAQLLPQATLTAAAVTQAIRACVEQPSVLNNMMTALCGLATPAAANAVADCCEQVARKGKGNDIKN